ncbi:CMP/dCMP deaminase zinc-binding [Thiorhodococcus drewsii AZ1]|uniref:CMP/dCMP deaminase zinc-binding n=1 Tax=Thiorhodococcus drewsii AZ1 TaxID=765913 RepID=G2E6M5_9GAMM|nr:CMP/dCMP deaminase zinc-binding [Thiorhodococcus drewsii AZ1]
MRFESRSIDKRSVPQDTLTGALNNRTGTLTDSTNVDSNLRETTASQAGAIRIDLPDWIPRFLASVTTPLADDRERMAWVLDLARENIRAGTGGPFGAALFAADSGRLIAVGVNRVVPAHCSIAHAEMVAIATAQQRLGHYDLRQALPGGSILYSSAEPCAMCLGALPWSGIDRLVYAASDADVRAIGFDEGDKPSDWISGYARRGIQVTAELLREEAADLLRGYAANGGEIYDPTATDHGDS